MYTSFHIKNFRCFEDLEFNDLARINLIGGRNNVGKTSVLEAIFLHQGRYDAVLSRMEVDVRRPSPYLKSEEIIGSRLRNWGNLFFGLDASRTISISGIHQNETESQELVTGENHADNLITIQIVSASDLEWTELQRFAPLMSPTDSLPYTDVLRFDIDNKHYHMLLYDNHASFANIPPAKNINTIFLPDRKRISLKDNADRFSNLLRQKQTSLVDDILRIIEPRIKEIELLSDGLYADVEGLKGLIPLDNMGEGISRITSAVLAVSNTPNGIVLIDEIENGLHYSILKDIWLAMASAADEFNTQIFATTHSLETIRAAHEAFQGNEDYDFRYHRLDRDPETDKISVMTYDQELMEAATDLAYEVR